MGVIERIEILLKGEGLKEQQLKERVGLLTSLDHAVSELMRQNPGFSFRGVQIFGSILNGSFTEKSDIDVYTCWEGYHTVNTPRMWEYLRDFESQSGRHLHEGPIIIDGRFLEIFTRTNGRKEFACIPFGVFLGDESYINQRRIEILRIVDILGDRTNWSSAQRYFNHWRNKDLTNPKGGYKLSSFQRLKDVYLK